MMEINVELLKDMKIIKEFILQILIIWIKGVLMDSMFV